MLKALGAVFLLVGAGALGFGAVRGLREHTRVLRQLATALAEMDEELSFRLTPIPAILEELGQRADGPAARFFRACLVEYRKDPPAGVLAGWQRAAELELPMLWPEELEALEVLGGILGRYDRDAQHTAIRQAVLRLEHFAEGAEARQGRLSRVYAAVSLATGLMTVILLV